VDIQVPDDARELYRDVQAYHRELRALRRHERSTRWRAPLRKSSMILPVVAGCLVLAMIAGMVLTMFSANPYSPVSTGQARVSPGAADTGNAGTGHSGGSPAGSSPLSSSPSATSASSGGPSRPSGQQLPADSIAVDRQPVSLRELRSTALAIIPAGCGCARAVTRLLAQASGITIYLVGRRGSLASLRALAPASARGTAKLAIDAHNALNLAYQPKGHLMILLVDSRGNVDVATRLSRNFEIGPRLRLLKQPG
jgi:hypothetical protein